MPNVPVLVPDSSSLVATARKLEERPDPDTTFRPLSIPKTLFDEVSKRFGVGDPFDVRLFVGNFHCRRLDSSSPFINGTYAIGLESDDGSARFVIFSTVPRQKDADTIGEAELFLKLNARVTSTGTWAFDRGTKMRDALEITIDRQNMCHPAAFLSGLVMMRAHQLVIDPSCIIRTFWDEMVDPHD